MSFVINVNKTSDVLSRFYKQVTRQESLPHWSKVELSDYPNAMIEQARRQWAGRATSAYYTMTYMSQLVYLASKIGLPLEIIGGASGVLLANCRHVESCTRFADLFGGREDRLLDGSDASLVNCDDDELLIVYEAVLAICAFNASLSAPIFDAITTVTTESEIEKVARTLTLEYESHARFGWETLTWLTARLNSDFRMTIQNRLAQWISHFEAICYGGPEMLDELAGTEIIVEQGELNLGTLTSTQYAAIYYHTLTSTVFPRLKALGFNAEQAWSRHYTATGHRTIPVGLGVVGIDAVAPAP